MPNESPIFYDVKGQRRRQAKRIGLIVGSFTAVVLTVVALSLALAPFIPNLPGSSKPAAFRQTHPPLLNPRGDEARTAGFLLDKASKELRNEIDLARRRHQPMPKASPEGPIVGAF